MMRLEEVTRISKTFYKTEEFTARHIISLANYMKKDGKDVLRSNLYCFDLTDKLTYDIRKGITINTSDSIILSRRLNTSYKTPSFAHGEDMSNQKLEGFVNIEPYMFPAMTRSLDIGIDWLCKPEFEKLYTVDVQGNTIGIADKKQATIACGNGGWILFKPAVIYDPEGKGYQGVFLKTNRGMLATLTGNEFVQFANYCKEIMTNFYTASLALYNAGLLSMLYIKSDTT